MEWVQRAIAVGEAFTGTECGQLRLMLQRQSGSFFRAFHASNLEASERAAPAPRPLVFCPTFCVAYAAIPSFDRRRRMPAAQGLPAFA